MTNVNDIKRFQLKLIDNIVDFLFIANPEQLSLLSLNKITKLNLSKNDTQYTLKYTLDRIHNQDYMLITSLESSYTIKNGLKIVFSLSTRSQIMFSSTISEDDIRSYINENSLPYFLPILNEATTLVAKNTKEFTGIPEIFDYAYDFANSH